MIELGIVAKDKITGFQGTVTGHTRYISGCNQVLLQPNADKDGKYVEGRWIDEDRLEQIGSTKITLTPSLAGHTATKGFDAPAPVR
jgi:hypothetical protein